MDTPKMLVPFFLDERRFALTLSAVEQVVRAIEITPLPAAPEVVLGVINARGRVIPVINLRRRFGLPDRKPELSDHLVLARTPVRTMALAADRVDGVIEVDARDIVRTESILPGAPHVEGVVKLADGLLLIQDLARFLSLDEEQALHNALKERNDHS